jgi:hypothetical protein
MDFSCEVVGKVLFFGKKFAVLNSSLVFCPKRSIDIDQSIPMALDFLHVDIWFFCVGSCVVRLHRSCSWEGSLLVFHDGRII